MKYFMPSIFFTFIIIFLIKEKSPFTIRKLFNNEIKEYICNKADSNLMNKYKNGFDEETMNKKEGLNKEQRALIEFFKNPKYENIKSYLKRIGVFIAILVLDVIFIFLWILVCVCCHKKICLFKKDKLTKIKCRIISSIVFIFNLLVIIFSIIVIILSTSFFKNVNGLGCSFMIFFDHINYGLSPSYANEAQHWLGLIGTIEKLKTNEEKFHNINYNNIEQAFNNAKYTFENIGHTECINSFDVIEEDKNEFYNFFNSIYKNINFDSKIKLIEKGKNVIEKTSEKIEGKLYDTLSNTVNNYIKNSIISFFILILFFSFMSLIILYLHYLKKNTYSKILYIINWNILTFLMIITILMSTTSGVIGFLLKDGIQIYYYIFSLENLVNDNPLILITKNKFLGSLIDTCANNGESFIDVFEKGVSALTDTEKDYYKEKISELNEKHCDTELKNKLVKFYEELIEIVQIVYDITADLLDIKCSFVRNDVNIILKEVDSGGEKGIYLSLYQFLVGIFLGISIFAGVILVHKYEFEIEIDNNENKNIKINNNKISSNKTVKYNKKEFLESNDNILNYK